MSKQLSHINQLAFFALIRAGLWEQEVQLLPFGDIDFADVQRLSEEQSVLGLVAAGSEHVTDKKIPKKNVLQIIGQTLQLEQRNQAMNYFIGVIIDQMRTAGIYTILVKGQGVAQCYERPLWRSCGDVDLLLSKDNYLKALDFLTPLAQSVDEENKYNQHIGMTIDPWVVELHGTLRSSLWKRIDDVVDEAQYSVFYGGQVRSWMNGNTQVFLPGVNEDVIFLFSHILQHFFKEGIGLRQICDWCRFLWTYNEKLDLSLLEKRLKKMGAMSEWKAFAALAVEHLGMEKGKVPFYSPSCRWSRKASKICSFIIETGNFGHNRDYSYYQKHSFIVYKAISLWRHIKDTFRYLTIFPWDAQKVLWSKLVLGVKVALKEN